MRISPIKSIDFWDFRRLTKSTKQSQIIVKSVNSRVYPRLKIFIMPESFASKIDRWKFNLFPAYRGTELSEIKALLETQVSVDRIYTVELIDKKGKVHCRIEKTLYIAKKGI